MKHLHIRIFCVFFSLITCFSVFGIYKTYNSIPNNIYVNSNEESVINLALPGTAHIISSNNVSDTIDLSNPIKIISSDTGQYQLKLKLFNIFSENVNVNVINKQHVYIGGVPIGIYMRTNGIYVQQLETISDKNNNLIIPCKNKIFPGDYIISINNEKIINKKQLSSIINNSNGNNMEFTLNRNGNIITSSVAAVMCNDGKYKLGIWVKDDTQGIGTLTYIKENGNYGALGHCISDNYNNTLQVSTGNIYDARILTIIKGEKGKPGEYVGAIDYNNKNLAGTIIENQSHGIFGQFSKDYAKIYSMDYSEIGLKYEVTTGNACIRIYTNDKFQDYSININKINYSNEKNITFTVTSEELIKQTNGIVQGMSGAPIIQNGKIIGAVTHVFVDDPCKGYGIFIEEMLKQNQ